NWLTRTTNGTAQTRTINQQNQYATITGDGGSSPTYDNNGSTTLDDKGNTITYDAWNRIVKVASGSTVLAVYAYDALGRRIQETHGTAAIDVYFSKEWQVLEERNSSNQPTAQYVWDPLSSDTLVERDSGTGLGT